MAIFAKLLKSRRANASLRDGDLVERVCVLVARTLDLPPSLHPKDSETQLHGLGLGLDSVDGLRLIAALEREFDVTIDDTELTPDTFKNIGSLVAVVRKLKCIS